MTPKFHLTMEPVAPVDIEPTPDAWQDYLVATGDYARDYQDPEQTADQLAELPIVRLKEGRVNYVDYSDTDQVVLVAPKGHRVRGIDIISNHTLSNYWWRNWEGYKHNPFEHYQRESIAIGREVPRVVIHNFGIGISDAEMDDLAAAYQWFSDYFDPDFMARAPRIIVGRHMADWHMEIPARPMYGQHDAQKSLVSLASFLLDGENSPKPARYEPLLAKGVSVLDIIATHELAHALMRPRSSLQELFEKLAGWDSKFYAGSRVLHMIFGLNGSGMGLPVTDHANHNPWEDAAETLTFYRFAPELLGRERLELVEQLSALAADLNEGGPNYVEPIKAMRLPGVVYPHHRVPEAIVAQIIRLSEPKKAESKNGEEVEY